MLIGAGFAFLILVVKRIKYTLLLGGACILLNYFTGSEILSALIVAVILTLCLGAFISSICPKRYFLLLLLIPIASYFGAYLMVGDPIFSLFAILLLPASFCMGMMQRKNSERKLTVAYTTVVLILCFVGVITLLLYRWDMLSVAAVSERIDLIREDIIEQMKALSVEVGGQATSIFKTELVEAAVISTFNTLPALVVTTAMVIIYFANSVQLSIYAQEGLDIFITEKSKRISMSVMSAVVFVVAYVLSLSTDVSGNTDMLGAVGANLRLILTPGLFLCGTESVAMLTKKAKAGGCLLFIGLILLFVLLSAYIFLIIAAVGAIHIIVKAIDSWAKDHYSKNTD